LTIGNGFLYVVNKVWYYTLETAGQRSPSEIQGGSGRGGDILIFLQYFPKNWVFGIGSFNSSFANSIAPAQNAYLTFLLELGVIGIIPLIIFWVLHYANLVKGSRSVYFLAFCFTFLVMIFGSRCFAWHELWYAQANTMRLKRKHQQNLTHQKHLGIFPKESLKNLPKYVLTRKKAYHVT